MNALILAAGDGTRMGAYSHIHKALLPIDGKAIISHLIDGLEEHNIYVVSQERHKDLRRYIDMAHPHREVTHIIIEPTKSMIDTMIRCDGVINGPTEIMPCDGIFYSRPHKDSYEINWFGVARNPSLLDYKEMDRFRSIRWDDGAYVTDKGWGGPIWTGRMFVKDYADFTECLRANYFPWSTDETRALNIYAAKSPFSSRYLKWKDFGVEDRWERVKTQKTDDHTYFVDGRVIKWFKDEEVTYKRVKRSSQCELFVKPDVFMGSMYSYNRVDGISPYEGCSPEVFDNFLNLMGKKLWRNDGDLDRKAMVDMYWVKPTLRLLGKGKDMPNIPLWRGVKSPIHGDLQLDNIIFGEEVHLIDWRESFGEHIDCGDLHYDFGKLLMSLIIDMKSFRENDIVTGNTYSNMNGNHEDYVNILKSHAAKYQLEWVNVIRATISIISSMAGIYEKHHADVLMTVANDLWEDIKNDCSHRL